MELSCSRGEGGLSQTVEEKKKHGLERDRVHYAAETAEHKETCASPGQKIEQGVLFVQLLRHTFSRLLFLLLTQ